MDRNDNMPIERTSHAIGTRHIYTNEFVYILYTDRGALIYAPLNETNPRFLWEISDPKPDKCCASACDERQNKNRTGLEERTGREEKPVGSTYILYSICISV